MRYMYVYKFNTQKICVNTIHIYHMSIASAKFTYTYGLKYLCQSMPNTYDNVPRHGPGTSNDPL